MIRFIETDNQSTDCGYPITSNFRIYGYRNVCELLSFHHSLRFAPQTGLDTNGYHQKRARFKVCFPEMSVGNFVDNDRFSLYAVIVEAHSC